MTWNPPFGERVVLVIREKTERMNRRIVWILFLLAAFVVSCAGPSKTVKKDSQEETPVAAVSEEKKKEFEYLFIEALKQKMVGNPQKSVSLLSACLEIDGNSSAAMYELANLHLMNNDLTSASLLLEKAIRINPGNKWYKLLLAKIYQQTGKNRESAQLFGQLAKMEPDREEYLFLKALELSSAKNFDEAIRTLDELEKKTGIIDQISLARQEIFLQSGKVKEAFGEIQRLIAAYPADPRYYGLLADLYKDQGDKENALKNYMKILELDPSNGFVNFSLASMYLDEGDTARAYEFTKKGFTGEGVDIDTKLQLYLLHTGEKSEFPLTQEQNEELLKILSDEYPDDFRIYSIYAEYLIRNKKNREAREKLLRVVEKGVNDYPIWEQILYLDNDLQEWQSLYDHGQSALEIYPNQSRLYFFQAIGALQLENFEDVISISDEGLNYVIDNNLMKGQFVFLKGEALYKQDKLNEAFALFDEAVELDPDNFMALNNYAYYLSLAGRNLEKAERMSGKVIKRFPDNATYLDTYAWVLFKKKNYTLARFYMETALTHSEEENATLTEHYGDILFMLGETEKALENWQKAVDQGSDSKILRQKISEKKYIEE